MKPPLPQTIVIIGPTASGKSDLAIVLARRYDGEIVSGDSCQVYRGMDIGTGKVSRDPTKKSDTGGKDLFFSQGVRHHLLDVASPGRSYNVTHFLRDAKKTLADIRVRGKTPIICGGTGFWIQALLEDTHFPPVKPDKVLRKKLGALSAEELFDILTRKDPRRAATIDPHNKVRLIRALEIISSLGLVPLPLSPFVYESERLRIIALTPPQATLHSRIESRLKERLKQGMLEEVAQLREKGISWNQLDDFGLEYRWCTRYLQKKISRAELEAELAGDIKQYAKRQITWLKRWEKIGAPILWAADTKEAEAALEGRGTNGKRTQK